jgi:hypothetical protein
MGDGCGECFFQKELKELKKDNSSKDEKNVKKIATLQDRVNKAKLNMNMKEELKTVSLGTSKINYLDPRITIAWCKKWEMPLNLVYTKALMEKFNWAMVRSIFLRPILASFSAAPFRSQDLCTTILLTRCGMLCAGAGGGARLSVLTFDAAAAL